MEGPKRRILFLSQCLPYPPYSGVTRRTYNIISQLSEGFEVALLAFYRKNHQPEPEDVESAREALQQVVSRVLSPVPISSEQSVLRARLNHLRSLWGREAYTYYEYSGVGFRRQLEVALDQFHPDLVHVDSLDLYRWLPWLADLATTCTHHSIESQLLRLRAERWDNPVLRFYMYLQADRLEEVERKYAPRVSVNLMMSTLDADRLRAIAPGAATAVVPNGVDPDEFDVARNATVEPFEVVFMGPLYMYPNWDAVEWFVGSIWPLVQQQVPRAQLTLVGKTSDKQASELSQVDGVRVLGFVPDVKPVIRRAACCVAPLRVGGGTRLKILEYWALERPVVSTTIGCEGLAVRDGHNMLVRNEPDGFAQGIADLLQNPERAAAIARGGRRTVEDEYSWNRIGKDLRSLYHTLLEDAGTRTARSSDEVIGRVP